MVSPPPSPALIPTTDPVPAPAEEQPVAGFDKTFDRRGDRALVQLSAGWAGRFLGEVEGGGAPRILCKLAVTAFARWLDDDHLLISSDDATWVGQLTPAGLIPVAGVGAVLGPITCLPEGMVAIGWPDHDGLRLLGFRDGWLRLYRGKVKPPAGAAEVDGGLVVGDGRVFAPGPEPLELTGWQLATDWDPAADWAKAVKKLTRSSGVPVTAVDPAPADPGEPAEHRATRQADGSRWRFEGERAAVAVGDRWCPLALPDGLSGPHYVELAEPVRRFLVGRLVHGAVDAERGDAWLVTADRKLLRASLDTGEAATVADLSSVHRSDRTFGVFALADGRVVVVGRDELAVVDPTGAAAPAGHGLAFDRTSACAVSGPVIAHTAVRPEDTKHGVPGAWLYLTELGDRVRTWLSWQLPLYAPTLRFDGRMLTAGDGRRALQFDLEAALAWFPSYAGRNDVTPLPPTPTRSRGKR